MNSVPKMQTEPKMKGWIHDRIERQEPAYLSRSKQLAIGLFVSLKFSL
jgi:hypothetical protein